MNDRTAATVLETKQGSSLVTMGFGSLASFEFMQRTAKMFSMSSMVPTVYRAFIQKGYGDNITYEENPSALPNCIIALNMSQRMNADPLMIMQNLHVIEGRPSWSSQFIIAAINSCGRYSPLRFDLVKGEEMDAEFTTYEWENKKKISKTSKVRIVNTTCVAWAIELDTKQRLESPMVSLEMAVAEGWYGKNGSKWRTMPEVMLRYRAAAFFGRIYAPELLMGLPTAEESLDVIDVERQQDGTYAADLSKADIKQPQSKSEAKAKAEAAAAQQTKQAPESTSRPAADAGKVTDVDFKDVDKTTAANAQQTSSEPQQSGPAVPLSEAQHDYLRMKMEQSAVSSTDIKGKFGLDMEQINSGNVDTVLAWVKNPD